MDFVDYRKDPNKLQKATEEAQERPRRRNGRNFSDYIEEIILEAQERGEFSNLEGTGKPLNLEDDHGAGDMSMAYHVLKSNGYAPPQIELLKEIRALREQAEVKIARVIHRGQQLRSRRVPPLVSEQRAFNDTVNKAAAEYERALRELNGKILTLNLTTPTAMHQPTLDIEKLLRQFHESCPQFP
ncbi:MAG: DUF1992 domain-containing protein [Ktedonobacteraceae bacterium]|nr:DUF1992 domain-containing protein [Ktedonobacteraceae bacterium]MBO0791963.1 DUF1992 domain-containing protein [Ktedonobacteraceae bacterium]